MSGIYIPGIRKPLSCLQCPCSGTDIDDGKEFWICEITHRVLTSTELCDNAPNDCPLIPVPDHGRLIDADALITKVTDAAIKQPEIADVYYEQASEIGEWLYSMPTIIPADKEGDNADN